MINKYIFFILLFETFKEFGLLGCIIALILITSNGGKLIDKFFCWINKITTMIGSSEKKKPKTRKKRITNKK